MDTFAAAEAREAAYQARAAMLYSYYEWRLKYPRVDCHDGRDDAAVRRDFDLLKSYLICRERGYDVRAYPICERDRKILAD